MTGGMAQREKRSISLPPGLARRIDEAATAGGTTFSGWLADTAVRRLRLQEGRAGIAAWEQEQGSLTPEELAEGLARARALLAQPPPNG
jgi:predicted transcriptional regulator